MRESIYATILFLVSKQQELKETNVNDYLQQLYSNLREEDVNYLYKIYDYAKQHHPLQTLNQEYMYLRNILDGLFYSGDINVSVEEIEYYQQLYRHFIKNYSPEN